jgi:hypothetical protein
MWTRVTSWRFALLAGVALLDAVVFLVPLVACALVVAAVVSPGGLRWASRFLDALADERRR